MKNSFSRVFALGFLVFASLPSWAQPNGAPLEPQVKPAWELSNSSADALTFIGAFYNKMRRAQSFRGRLTINRTSVKEGKVITRKTFDLQQSWLDDGEKEGDFNKIADNFTYTMIEGGVTRTEKRSISNDSKNYNLDEIKNIYSTRIRRINEKATILTVTRTSWIHALAMFGAGSVFKTERKIVDGQERFIIKNNPVAADFAMEYVFNANNGDLQSWKRTRGNTTIEYLWLKPEFDVLLEDSIFGWKAPEGATEVALDAMRLPIEL